MVSDAPVGYETDPEDPIRKAFATVRRGVGWAIGFIGFGIGWALTYWRP